MNFKRALTVLLTTTIVFTFLGMITAMVTDKESKDRYKSKTVDNEVKTVNDGGNLLRTEDKSLYKTNYNLSSLSLNDRVIHIYGEINEMSACTIALQS